MQIEEMIENEENVSIKKKRDEEMTRLDLSKRARGNSEHRKRDGVKRSIFEEEDIRLMDKKGRGDEVLRLSESKAAVSANKLEKLSYEMPKIDKGNYQLLRIDLDDPISK